MPMPKSRATRLTVQTVGIRIICMSMSGSLLRASAITQTGSMTAAITKSPITLSDDQPQWWPWLTPTSSATSQMDMRNAVPTLILPGVRSGDSGTQTAAAIAAMTVMIIGIQNSQW